MNRFLRSQGPPRAVVAIPAHDEAGQIAACLAALAVQRDRTGAPVPQGQFEIIVFANTCSDSTAATARRCAENSPHRTMVVEEMLPADRQNAGWARKRAMDLAAARLTNAASDPAFILTTDADSSVGPTWFSDTMEEFANGVDAVAGYIDGNASDLVSLGPQFLARGRLEDTYLRQCAEIYARCDPRPHDPWPNHRVSSGASLAITLPAYIAVGGLPPRPLGEDAALTEQLERAGFKVRHSMDVCVSTSCRLDGRAMGGAADTMRYRQQHPDAWCDDEIEPALHLTRRAVCRGLLRRAWTRAGLPARLLTRLRVSDPAQREMVEAASCFEDAWRLASAVSPILKARIRLRPSDLPRQIVTAEAILRRIRAVPHRRRSAPADKHRPVKFLDAAFS